MSGIIAFACELSPRNAVEELSSFRAKVQKFRGSIFMFVYARTSSQCLVKRRGFGGGWNQFVDTFNRNAINFECVFVAFFPSFQFIPLTAMKQIFHVCISAECLCIRKEGEEKFSRNFLSQNKIVIFICDEEERKDASCSIEISDFIFPIPGK